MNLVLFLLGLAVGSFINMAVWRVEYKQPILKKQRSFCDFCKKPLRFYDNIPLLSFWFTAEKADVAVKNYPGIIRWWKCLQEYYLP